MNRKQHKEELGITPLEKTAQEVPAVRDGSWNWKAAYKTGIPALLLALGISCGEKQYTIISQNRELSDKSPAVFYDEKEKPFVLYISGKPHGVLNKIYMASPGDAPKKLEIPNLETLIICEDYAVSPDGKKMYLRFSGVSTKPGEEQKIDPIDIWEVDTSTGKIRKITNGEELIASLKAELGGKLPYEKELELKREYAAANPSVSPDGKNIAYDWNGKDGFGIYVQDIGGEPRKLVVGRYASWAPDGNGFIYIDFDSTLSYASLDGKTRQIKRISGIRTPKLSPDGKRIVFAYGEGGIGVINSDGTNLIEITNSGYNTRPCWVDNDTIVYEDSVRKNREILMKDIPPSKESNPKAKQSYNRELAERQMSARNDRFENYRRNHRI